MLTRHLVAVTLLSLMALTSAQTNIGTGGAFHTGLALPFIFNQFRRQPHPVVYPYPIQTNFQPNFFNPRSHIVSLINFSQMKLAADL